MSGILLGLALRALAITLLESRPGNCWPLVPEAAVLRSAHPRAVSRPGVQPHRDNAQMIGRTNSCQSLCQCVVRNADALAERAKLAHKCDNTAHHSCESLTS